MKKQLASRRLLMWVMVHLSISGVLSKSNHTTTTTSLLCDGSVEDCLNVHHLDSQLPTISSSHSAESSLEKNAPKINLRLDVQLMPLIPPPLRVPAVIMLVMGPNLVRVHSADVLIHIPTTGVAIKISYDRHKLFMYYF